MTGNPASRGQALQIASWRAKAPVSELRIYDGKPDWANVYNAPQVPAGGSWSHGMTVSSPCVKAA